jgi:hypothetical protein
MPERWQRELRRLGAEQVPDRVRERMQEGPRGDGMPSARHRVIAAAVAFAVFFAAGSIAWLAFRPTGSRGVGGDAVEPAYTEAVVAFHELDPEYPDFPYAEMSVDGQTVRGQFSPEFPNSPGHLEVPSFVDPVPLPIGSRIVIDGDADAVAGVMADSTSGDPLEDVSLIDGHGYVMTGPGRYFLMFEAKWGTDTVPFYFPIDVVPVEADLRDSDAELSINAYPFEAVLSYGGQRISVPASSGSWTKDGEGFGVDLAGHAEVPDWARILIPAGTRVELTGNWANWRNSLRPGDGRVTSDDGGSLVFPSSPGTYDWRMTASWPEGEAEFTFGIDLLEPIDVREASLIPSPSIDAAPETAATANALRVACEPEGAVVLTPSVAARPDGLQIVPTGVPDDFSIGVFSTGEPGTSWWSGSDGVDDAFLREVPPGDLTVVCYRTGTDNLEPEQLYDSGTSAVLEDPHGYFVSYELSCLSESHVTLALHSYASIEDPADLEAASALLLGVLPDDQIERAGYPESRGYVRIVRSGDVVAWLQVGAPVHGAACSSSGIRSVD